jgi:hypothetical protein
VGDVPDPYWNNVVLLMQMDDDFKDSSTKKHGVATVGSVGQSSASRFASSKSLTIANTSSGLLVEGTNDFVFPNGTDFTFEAWIINYQSYRDFKQIIGQWGGPNAYQMSLFYNTLGWQTPSNGGRTGTTTVTLNAWHHVAVCRKGTKMYLWLDGHLEGVWDDTIDYNFDASVGLGVGKVAPQNGYNFVEGAIDCVRITKGVGRYTEAFDPMGWGKFANYGPA